MGILSTQLADRLAFGVDVQLEFQAQDIGLAVDWFASVDANAVFLVLLRLLGRIDAQTGSLDGWVENRLTADWLFAMFAKSIRTASTIARTILYEFI